MKLGSLCVVIPAYNEEASLPGVLEAGARAAAAAADTWEILVVDDGSTDGTPGILKAFAAACPRLRVVRHDRNRGIPYTVREALTSPGLEWSFFIPGDGQIPPEELQKLLPYAGDYDLIYGWRRQRADPFRRRVGTWAYNSLISLWLGRRIHDVNTGLLYRTGPLRGLSLRAESSFVHAEFLGEALRRGLRHVEVPVRHLPRVGGRPLGSTPRLILTTALEFFGGRLKGMLKRR